MDQFCEITLDRERLKSEVRNTYTQVAEMPTGDFHFHRLYDHQRLAGFDPVTGFYVRERGTHGSQPALGLRRGNGPLALHFGQRAFGNGAAIQCA